MRKNIRKIVTSRWVGIFIRLGYIIRGILYGSVGVVALQIVFGFSYKGKNTSDVLYFIHDLSFGNILLGFTIIGLLGYAIWSFIRAGLDLLVPQVPHMKFITRVGYIFSACSYILLIFPTLGMMFLPIHKHRLSPINQLLLTLLDIPFGRFALILIGMATMLGGIMQMHKAIRADDPSDFWSEETHDHIQKPFMFFARIGTSVRGLVFSLIGYFILLAGMYINPADIKGIDGVIDVINEMHYGYIFLLFIGIGLVFFGVYSALLSILVDLPNKQEVRA
jgi:hypothetical protein